MKKALLHRNNVGPHVDKVTNYHMKGDILTNVQYWTPLPDAIGKQVQVIPTLGDALIGELPGGGIYLHMIGPMQRSLNR